MRPLAMALMQLLIPKIQSLETVAGNQQVFFDLSLNCGMLPEPFSPEQAA
jgi:hypothetical protein